MELRKHKAQAPLLLAENLGRVRVQYTKFNVQYENLLHDRFSGKVREIFQVYNNCEKGHGVQPCDTAKYNDLLNLQLTKFELFL